MEKVNIYGIYSHTINEYVFKLECTKTFIIIELITITLERYKTIIKIDDPFWIKNKKYFQDNFLTFRKLLKETLIDKTGELLYKIIKDKKDIYSIELKYSALLGFTINIDIHKVINEEECNNNLMIEYKKIELINIIKLILIISIGLILILLYIYIMLKKKEEIFIKQYETQTI